MLGNLSQTVVKLPGFFKNSLFNSSSRNKVKKPPVIDTFNQMKKVNFIFHKRLFRLNDFIKNENPSIDLNFNHNRRYFSPEIIRPNKDFNSVIFGTNIKSNNNNYLLNSNNINQLINNSNINENINNITTEKNKIEDEKKDKEILKKKTLNLNELKIFIDKQSFYDEHKKNSFHFPKIKNKKYEEVYQNALERKIDSLTTVRPEIKKSIFKKNKNYTLEKDYFIYKKLLPKNKNDFLFNIKKHKTINLS